jgi:hypothetical protein
MEIKRQTILPKLNTKKLEKSVTLKYYSPVLDS